MLKIVLKKFYKMLDKKKIQVLFFLHLPLPFTTKHLSFFYGYNKIKIPTKLSRDFIKNILLPPNAHAHAHAHALIRRENNNNGV